jgi:hypothetical protein
MKPRFLEFWQPLEQCVVESRAVHEAGVCEACAPMKLSAAEDCSVRETSPLEISRTIEACRCKVCEPAKLCALHLACTVEACSAKVTWAFENGATESRLLKKASPIKAGAPDERSTRAKERLLKEGGSIKTNIAEEPDLPAVEPLHEARPAKIGSWPERGAGREGGFEKNGIATANMQRLAVDRGEAIDHDTVEQGTPLRADGHAIWGSRRLLCAGEALR